MAKVLLVSYVRELLDERDHVLRVGGHSTTLASNSAEAFQAVQEQDFDIAVLGFSIPNEERKELAHAIKEANTNTKIIMIYFDSIKDTELADVLVKTSAGADSILRAVNHILNMVDQSRTG